jgi:5-methylthioadenosine/S-adenosylhomocysteine deaminase
MGENMKNVDTILFNATILTMDKNLTVYEPGAIAILQDHIVDVGLDEQILKNYEPESTIDCRKKVLMPGLVNAHTHVPMTLLRGLADDLKLDVWLMGYMMPVEREFVAPEFVKLGTKLGCAEMIRSGVTTFADMYYFEDQVAEAVAESGMRAVCSQTVLKFPSPDARSFEESLNATREFIKKWKGHPLIVPSVGPHAPYTCTDEILQAAASLAVEFDVPLHTHLAETAFEVENMRREHGMPVVPYVKKQNLFDARVIAAHCVHIDEGEIRTLFHHGASVVHNPSSNIKLASGFANIKRMIEIGLNVGIGTDGPASNNDLDMFEEIRLAAFLAKVTSGDPTALPAKTALLMGTRMGAQALHIGHLTGSLEPGKRADIILIDIQRLHNAPRFRRDPDNIYAQIVYASKSSDVTDVMVNGQWIMKNQGLITLNEFELIQQSQQIAQKIDQFLFKREQSVVSKLIAIGGASQEESFEVQVKIPVNSVDAVVNLLEKMDIRVIRKRHYREYDNYFHFDNPDQGLLRFREDHFIDEKGEITNVRTRLTHIGPSNREEFSHHVLLSRSRFIAPATQSLRFYKEYFIPAGIKEVEKERFRYLVLYKTKEFFINLDHLTKPDLGSFLEVKSRTWSRQDAESKAHLAVELIAELGAALPGSAPRDYFEML